jgi:DNA polymerase-1
MKEGAPKLYVLDGNSLLYRSYYAIKSLSNSKGFPTNAIYGFLLTLRKLIDKEKPHYLGVVFDVKGPTIRHKAYQDYKAHRRPMPEDMQVQVPVLKKILQAYHLPVFEYPEYEADDVLGSLTRRASQDGIPSVVVSTDKDLLQLVDEMVMVYNPAKDVYLDEAGVRELFGVKPAQVRDVLSLWGDQSDNVPGVPGVGEKISKNLIAEFGSLDKLLKNLDKIKNPRVREAIKTNLDKLELSRTLVTIERGLTLDFDLRAFALSAPDTAALSALFQELEFTSLLNELAKPEQDLATSYGLIQDESALRQLVQRIKKEGFVSLDTETDNVDPVQARLVGMSFSIKQGEAFYLPLRHDYPQAPAQVPVEKALAVLREILADPALGKIGQNIKYDAIVLGREGAELRGIDLDSMILSYLLEPNWGKHNKEKLAASYLQLQAISYSDIAGKGKDEVSWNAVALDKAYPYSCQDADLALRLCRLLWTRVQEAGLDRLYREVEQPLIEVLADMERTGVRIDPRALGDLSREIAADMKRLEKKIFELSGSEFNLNSPRQLGQVLFEKMNLPSTRKTKVTKGYSTSFDVLQELAPLSPVARYALEYRQLTKLKSTYADALPELVNPETGRVHTSYNQTVTATGRLSSSDPNLQNIPARGEMGRRFRQAFIPEAGHLFLEADYSQIELRVLAHLSQDQALIESFRQDLDIHAATARRVFGESSTVPTDEQRRRAKIINFSMIYGASAFSLARELETSNAEAQNFIDLYYEKHPKVREYLESMVEEAKKTGYATTLFGRRRQVPELQLKDKNIQLAGRRIALNTPIQGTAADLMKMAMIEVWRALREQALGAKLILQVHDELVFEVPDKETSPVEALVREKMENIYRLEVPLKVRLSWGINWAEAK